MRCSKRNHPTAGADRRRPTTSVWPFSARIQRGPAGTRHSITPRPPRTIGPRRAACPRAFRASTTSGTSRSDGSASNGPCWRGISTCCSSAVPASHDVGFHEMVDGVGCARRPAPHRALRCAHVHGDGAAMVTAAGVHGSRRSRPRPTPTTGRSATRSPRACPSEPQSSVTHVLRDMCYLCLRKSVFCSLQQSRSGAADPRLPPVPREVTARVATASCAGRVEAAGPTGRAA